MFIFLTMMGLKLSLNEYELEYTCNLSGILLIGVNKAEKVTAVRSYLNADIDKKVICEENKKKSGVYCWTNIKNGKRYVGSSVYLSRRFLMYYNLKIMNKVGNNSYIYKAMVRYGYSSFRLDILEYCEKEKVIEREQYYIDLMKPEYNILRVAGSSLGHKQSEETLKKRRGNKRPHLLEINKKKGIGVEVKDMETKETKLYSSIREAARAIGCEHSTIRYSFKVFAEKGCEKLIYGRIIVRKK